MTGAPRVGANVRDAGRGRFGTVVQRGTSYVRLRPLGGGREWDADPEHVHLLSRDELVRARLTVVNKRSSADGR